MASIKDLKKRIGTVKNTQQTTRAMKMVAAAKLRRSQEAIASQRPYARQIARMIGQLLTQQDRKASRLLGRQVGQVETGESALPKLQLVLITSDRGLCGGFNGSVIKLAQRWMASHQSEYSEITMSFVGRKGSEFFKDRAKKRGTYFQELGGKVTFGKAQSLADALVESVVSEQFDEVKIIYNEFKNAATQKAVVEDFLPLAELVAEGEGQSEHVARPSRAVLLERLLKKNFAIQTFRILLESQAGEHGARMAAMENATKNAGEMISRLTLQYNKQRQAGITKELLEIISGSESQKAS